MAINNSEHLRRVFNRMAKSSALHDRMKHRVQNWVANWSELEDTEPALIDWRSSNELKELSQALGKRHDDVIDAFIRGANMDARNPNRESLFGTLCVVYVGLLRDYGEGSNDNRHQRIPYKRRARNVEKPVLLCPQYRTFNGSWRNACL